MIKLNSTSYEAPTTEVVELKPEKVICGSTRSLFLGEESGSPDGIIDYTGQSEQNW